MKKLFKAIRHEDLEEVRAIIEKKPDAISSVATPPPKKDIGQSPLQVATKIGAFDIAYYLMEKDADVNFMEEEIEGTQLRCPILQDAIRTALQSLCYRQFETSEKGVELVRELLLRGADPNKCASNGFDALNVCVSEAERVLDSQGAYPDAQEEAERQLVRLLDILIENGADFKGWALRGHFPEPHPGEQNKVRYLDDFIPQEDCVHEITIRGKTHTTVYKGDIDRTAHTRAVMQAYCRDRNISI